MKITMATIALLALASCTPRKEYQSAQSDPVSLEHATKFKLYADKVVVTEPWPGAKEPVTYTISKKPQRVICTSTTYLPFIELIGESNTLVGFHNLNMVNSPEMKALIEKGEVVEIGDGASLNIELILGLDPDLIFAYDAGYESTTMDKISEAGIPVVYNADFLETSALGKAEWIRFFGAFYQKLPEADSIFQSIKANYNSLKTLAKDVRTRPTILSGTLYGDTWFLAGGGNWMATFFADAGGNYLWADDDTNGWLEISFESVYEKAHDADYWIGLSSFTSLYELESQDHRYASFESFKEKRVYNYSRRINEAGGNDFFESGYSRPDLVLADLIKVLHPELLPDHEFVYYEQLP